MPLTFFASRPRAPSRLLAALLALGLAGCQSVDLSRNDLAAGLAAGSKAPAFSVASGEVVPVRAASAIVVDADTGRVLYSEDPDGLRHPASLSKLMTLYLLFEAIEAKRVTLDTELVVSTNAAAKPPSKLGLRAGSTIRVRDAMYALAVKSANDVASVVAENLGDGSEQAFARQMTVKARQLGMNRSNFVTPSGLPDDLQISTARDMAVLALQIRKRFPGFVPLFSTESFDYAGRHYVSTNKLLGRVPGVDGMKTGFVNASGFNLVASARRNGRGVIVVVIGGQTGRSRDARVEQLIDTYLGPAV
ncbi:D-alanyl-D-alanine carboxypeptidase family protein [Aureimonas ureilytica]|uniref:D-alanyl-D-alanine carboxypeptidase family protein n=1 Tax=Aureimonas ureilytica TaxID=401562 RepID=UPI00036C7D84|nr:D-alanyl-D-alanine carboxypeptidase family protein [Aureimonas ureilytica]